MAQYLYKTDDTNMQTHMRDHFVAFKLNITQLGTAYSTEA